MAKIKLNTEIKNINNEPIKEGDKIITLGDIVRNAVLSPGDKDKADDKVKKFELAVRCVADTVELTAEETTLIKDCIGNMYPPLIVGRSFEILDPK